MISALVIDLRVLVRSVVSKIRFRVIRDVASFFLFIVGTIVFCQGGSYAADGPSYIGDYSYSWANCASGGGGFSSEGAAVNDAGTVYSRPMNCPWSVTATDDWAQPGESRGICGGTSSPTYVMGVETSNAKNYNITYYAPNAACLNESIKGSYFLVSRNRTVCTSTQRYSSDKNGCVNITAINSYGNLKNNGPTCPHCGDPVHPGTGNSFQREADYVASVTSGLSFVRYYNSSPAGANASLTGAVGARWTHTYDSRLKVYSNTPKETCYIRQDNNRMYCDFVYPQSASPSVAVARPDGKVYRFSQAATGAWIPDADVSDRITATYDTDGVSILGWTYVSAQGDVTERYDAAGRLLTITNRAGLTQTLTYSDGTTNDTSVSRLPLSAPVCSNAQAQGVLAAGQLVCVTDNWGRQLQFEYDAQGRISKAIDPANQVYLYEYDGASGGCATYSASNPACAANNLTKVTYPDGRSRVYYYNEVAQINGGSACYGQTAYGNGFGSLPNAMTGLVDENGVRYASWAYDCMARVTTSVLAGNVNKVTLAHGSAAAGVYSSTTNTTNITYTYGDSSSPKSTSSISYGYKLVNGTTIPNYIGTNCIECGPVTAWSYDANGNVTSRKEWNNNATCYAYDLSRNLETTRIEGVDAYNSSCSAAWSATSLAAPLRKISTQWHATYRLPVKIAEPLKLTTYSYDATGNLLTKTEQATTDTTGIQGFNATATGASRSWSYTYNNVGQVLTAIDPLNNTTTYSYDSQGNLSTVTNAAGHVTTLSNYDAHGRVGRITDPNGLVVDLTYNPRGWLISKNVGGETTSYEYDGVGQLTLVTLPDDSFISYTYDDAHRLTGIADSLGNSISYTLDLRGNRTKELVKDATGMLARQVTRVFDSLSRLQQITYSGGQAAATSADAAGPIPATSITSLVVAPAQPNVTQSVALLSTVMGSTPTGTVSFNDGNAVLGSVELNNGAASIVVPPLPVGKHSLTATYSGDQQNKSSTSAPENFTVYAPTTTALTIEPSTPSLFQSATFTATVTGSNPGGTVTFKDGQTVLGTATLSNGVATFTTTISTAGARTYVAAYGGDSQNLPSASPATTTNINRLQSQLGWNYPAPPSSISAGTTIYLRVAVNPVPAVPQGISDQPLDNRNPVSGADGSFGTVTVKDGSTVVASATVLCNQTLMIPTNGNDYVTYTGCWATFPATVSLSNDQGAHTLTAEYSGNKIYLPSTLSAQVTVTPMVTSTTQLSCPNTSVIGIFIDCKVTVVTPAYQPYMNGQPVQVVESGTVLGSGTLSPWYQYDIFSYWQAPVRIPAGLSVGPHNLQGQYPGAAATAPSISDVFVHTVNGPAATQTNISCPPTAPVGADFSCTVTVSSSEVINFSGQTVQVMEGSTVVGSATISDATPWNALVRISGLGAGTHTLQGSYPGFTSAQPSVSPAVQMTVQ